MSDPIPPEGILPGSPTPTSADGFTKGIPPKPPAPAKKRYESDDGDAPLPSLTGGGTSGDAGLQSLAQAARGSQLNQARWTMIIVGVITIASNLFYFASVNRDTILRDVQNQRLVVNPDTVLVFHRVITGLFIVMGIVFVILGMSVKVWPVLCTSLGLILYIAGFLISAVLDPATMAQGSIVKIIIVVALFRAIQAAWSYESEQSNSAA